jgi:hypothetical protein
LNLDLVLLFGIPLIKRFEKSISVSTSNTLPAPVTCEPLLIIGAYATLKLSPNTGTVTLKSTIVMLGLLPGTFKKS